MYTDFDRYADVCVPFIDNGYITGFDRVISKGKEATILHCSADESLNTQFVALKIYKESQYRNFKNDAPYLAGKVWDKRLLKRLKMVKDTIWVETEYQTLDMLYGAGVRVPRPYTYMGNGVLMEYIGDEQDDAPLLKDQRLTQAEARGAYEQILNMLDLMTMAGIVHGDLSAFNILYADNGPVIIDFPQAVSISAHPDARELFDRDVKHVVEYFSRFCIDDSPWEIADDIWTRYYRF